MNEGPSAASLPPELPGLDPAWSRLVSAPDHAGVARSWHVLDSHAIDARPEPSVTLLCVHGNPTWSYLWRELLAQAPPDVRVIAPDQLDMGYSDRTGIRRRLADRIDDLTGLTDVLGPTGPVVTVAHDWGGPISIGWAARHRHLVRGIVLSNTAVHHPPGAPAPTLIRVAGSPWIRERMCVTSDAFVRGALALSSPRPDPAVRSAYLAPYGRTARREAIGAFVEDIPLDDEHPSRPALDAVAAALGDLDDVPALLLWGTRDPVFAERYLHDLRERLPHADVHRFVGAGHLAPEDADVAGAVHAWTAELTGSAPRVTPPRRSGRDGDPLWAPIDERSDDQTLAVAEMGDGVAETRTWAELHADVARIGAGLTSLGVRAGDRVALMVPPGVDLTVLLYACWRIGAVVVIADAGLGPRGLTGALRSAAPDWIVGIPKALAAARALRWPGRRVIAGGASAAEWALADTSLSDVRALGSEAALPPPPGADAVAAVVFTSGATGPAKGVRYRHHELRAQRAALMRLYDIGEGDRLVAAFAPFALYGPAMGIASVVPSMDVTEPASLTASALAAAAAAVEATLVFASPAALANVSATADALTERDRRALADIRLLLSAGAPVDPPILRAALELTPAATAHTPYGMTEVLPVADTTLAEIDAAGPGDGVCVGRPLIGVDVELSPLDGLGRPGEPRTVEPGVTGEVCVDAAHRKDGYDRLWYTEWRSRTADGWHRTGDVGHFDDEGRLWIEGRLQHVITTPYAPLTPVGLERSLRSADGVDRAAVVGVGPSGAQVVVAVIVPSGGCRRPALADDAVADAVRAMAASHTIGSGSDLTDGEPSADERSRSRVGVDIAAVFVAPTLPVDIRHESKVDRLRIAAWAERVLAGGRITRL